MKRYMAALDFILMIFFLLLLSSAIRCSNKITNNFIPEGFSYPDSNIELGKTFIYQNTSTGQRTFKDLRNLNTDGQHFVTVRSYDSTSATDSLKILNGKAVEVYNFFMDSDKKPIKEELLQDTIVNKRQRLTRGRYVTNELIYLTSSKQSFLKDTIITWKGHQLPCLVVVANATFEIRERADTSQRRAMEVFTKEYHAKGIGVIQYAIQFTDQSGKDNYGLWKLVEITDIKS